MYKFIFTFLVFLSTQNLYAAEKDTVTLAELTQKVKSGKIDTMYYGFEEGDEMLFSLQTNGHKIKQISIVEMRGGILFKAYKIDTNLLKSFRIHKKCVIGIYIENTSILGKVYQLKIKRVFMPKPKPFNTNIVWKPILDTTFNMSYESYVEKTDTIFENVLERTCRVHSMTAINLEPNRQLIDFYLPANCIGWTYWISVGNEGKAAYAEAKKNGLKSLAGVANMIPEYGPLIALALNGAIALNSSPPGDNIQYWFIDNKKESEKFIQKADFKSFKQGNIVKDYGKINAPSQGYIYIGILNDNLVESIDVDLKILAIRTADKYGLKTVKKVNKITYKGTEPFNAY
jgi:hypothetical protein